MVSMVVIWYLLNLFLAKLFLSHSQDSCGCNGCDLVVVWHFFRSLATFLSFTANAFFGLDCDIYGLSESPRSSDEAFRSENLDLCPTLMSAKKFLITQKNLFCVQNCENSGHPKFSKTHIEVCINSDLRILVKLKWQFDKI